MSVIDAAPNLCVVGRRASATANSARDRLLRDAARQRGWQLREIVALDTSEMDEGVALLLLPGAADERARRQFPHALIVAETAGAHGDLVIDGDADPVVLEQLLTHSEQHWRRSLKVMELYRDVAERSRRMTQLSEIALAMSRQVEFDELLATILLEARRLANCDAGSVYLIDESGGAPELVFKLAQNDSVDVPFVEQRLPLTAESLAGYVALSGETLDIPDAYAIDGRAPYRFNRSFDQQMGYRTRSLLVLPMRDHRHRVVGVLQFINRLEPTCDEPVPFGDEMVELLKAIASQAAVSIQKNLLIRDVNDLFESFVQASVKAIEQRDPSTSGHSFRVAESTVRLFLTLPKSGMSRFRGVVLTEEHVKEVRYAALLHDFGKVGVRESLLLKANKLPDERLEVIRYRVELQKERLRRRAVEREVKLLHDGAMDLEVARRRVHRDLEAQLAVLDRYFHSIVKANSPSVLDEGDFDDLREIRNYAFRQIDGSMSSLLTESELDALSVRRGSLTPEEREEIQGHVSNTREFLAVLPWPPELARVPEIAGAHHEKLNGTGYPDGLAGEQIPLPSRVMTVCDIYDALTAMDRPYKKAIPADAALRILEEEAGMGLLDQDMVRIFIDSGLYRDVWAGHGAARPVVGST